MIAAAENATRPGDVVVSPSAANGLPIPSRGRPAKIATVDAGQVERIGRLAPAARRRVTEALVFPCPGTPGAEPTPSLRTRG